jgi:hypothetical protein
MSIKKDEKSEEKEKGIRRMALASTLCVERRYLLRTGTLFLGMVV